MDSWSSRLLNSYKLTKVGDALCVCVCVCVRVHVRVCVTHNLGDSIIIALETSINAEQTRALKRSHTL